MEQIYVTFRSIAVIVLIVVYLTTQSFAGAPKRPPKIDIGSFECVPSSVNDITRDVIIYWQIHESEKHSIDDLFEYRAYYTSMADNKTVIYHPCSSVFANHATFVGLELNIGYNIRVYSANKYGLSEKYASIYIPSLPGKRNDTTSLSLTKVKTYNDRGVYELSWKIDDNQKLFAPNQLNYYTLYWCENDMFHPNQCNGYMDWIHVPSTETSYTITVKDIWKDYQFAISANSETLQKSSVSGNGGYIFKSVSSGMVWETCTTLHITNTSKVKSFWISEVGNTYMALRWKFDCSEQIDFIHDFHVFYCPIHSVDNYSCLEPPAYKSVKSYMKQDYTPFAFLSDLKPSTMYKISIVIYTLNDSAIESESVTMTTLTET